MPGLSAGARPFDELLPDYFAYLEVEDTCTHSGQKCLNATERFLRTFTTPYLVKKVRILRFKGLCNTVQSYQNETLKELLLLAPEAPSGQIIACGLKLRHNAPEQAWHLFKLVFLRGDRQFLKVKDLYTPARLTSEEIQGLIQGLLKIDYERPYNGPEEAKKILLALMARDQARVLWSLLGKVYMRLKDYQAAADAFIKANASYEAAVAYIRADKVDRVEFLIRRLSKSRDPIVYRIMLLQAEQLRRQNKITRARAIFWKVYKYSEDLKEEALWRLAWMAYLQRDLYSAMARFKRLQSRWPKDRYAYWLKRTLEKLGYRQAAKGLSLDQNHFYGLLESLRSGKGLVIKVRYRRVLRPERGFVRGPLLRAWALNLLGQRDLSVQEALWQYRQAKVTTRQVCEFFRQTEAWWMMPWCQMRLPDGPKLYYRFPYAYPETVQKVAEQTGVDPLLILAVMKQESRFNPWALSRSGAIGLMQLMPFTARRFLHTNGPIHRECLKIEKNLLAGARYLRFLLDEFGSTAFAVAAYNAGEGSVGRWLEAYDYEGIDEFIEDIPYSQTYHYTQKVLLNYYYYQSLYGEETLAME